MENVLYWQWGVLILASLLIYLVSPRVTTNEGFFAGVALGDVKPNYFTLTFSLVISWIFAKSITNAANLGLSFGIVGGLAYAAYYFSFLVGGYVIYKLRTKGKFQSIHQFLNTKFGTSAIIIFSLLIGIRLLNEIWSNSMVIGTYFGEQGSTGYVLSIIVFTGLTLAYTLKGGLLSSLFSDLIQMGLFAILLFVVLSLIFGKTGSITPFVNSGSWSFSGGLDLFFVALIQIFSYPFHDPVMTDRGFIADERTTLKSFFTAGVLGFIFILFFSLIGVYGKFIGVEGQAAVEVAKTLGVVSMIIMNFIMITSASSTIDSTFSSISKLIVVDLGNAKSVSVRKGRIAMILTAIGGTIPIFFSPTILSATTISGTMVLGLAPVFIFWNIPAPKLSFYSAVIVGLLAGLAYVFGWVPEDYNLTVGKYAGLLTINFYASILILVVYFLPIFYKKIKRIK